MVVSLLVNYQMESLISKQNKWFLYVLLCADGSYYTGVTTDTSRRLYEHNHSQRGAKYTRRRRPVNLIYSVSCANRSEAQKAEYKFKKLNRKQKEAVIYESR